MDISIIIPFYNEEDALPSLFCEIESLFAEAGRQGKTIELLFVDDGSTDQSLSLVKERYSGREDAQILHWRENRGVGYAMRHGFRKATCPAVICYDSDATYPIMQIFTLVEALEGADVVTASPFMEGGGVEGVSSHRLFLSRFLSFLYRKLPNGKMLSTYSCGFRAYRKEALEEIAPRADGFQATAEILYKSVQKGLRIREHPSVLSQRCHGYSKMPFAHTAWCHVKFLLPLYAGGLFKKLTGRKESNRPENPAPGVQHRGSLGDRENQLELAKWNSRLNEQYPMAEMLNSRNPLIRFAERSRRRSLLKLAGKRAGRMLVDLGCESGGIAGTLKPSFQRICCVDIDGRTLGISKRENGEHQFSHILGDVQNLGLRSGFADVSILSAVLEHLPHPRLAIDEAVRITRAGGRILLCIPNDPFIMRIKRVFRFFRLGRMLGPAGTAPAPGHLHRFDRKAIQSLIPAETRICKFFFHLRSLCFFLLLEKEQ